VALLPHPEHAVHIAMQKEEYRVKTGVLVLANVSIGAAEGAGPAVPCTKQENNSQ
jgi:hypothetical protein